MPTAEKRSREKVAGEKAETQEKVVGEGFKRLQPYQTFQNLSKPFKTFQNLTKPFKTFQNLSKPFKTFQNLYRRNVGYPPLIPLY